MEIKSFFLALLTMAILFMLTPLETKAQSTTVGTLRQVDKQQVVWTVASGDFDSAATIWSKGFVLELGSETFDAQGTINLATVADDSMTYSAVIMLYAMYDESTDKSGYILVDSLGTATATTLVKLNGDLDDFDQGPIYKFKAYNNGWNNSFKLGFWRE